MTKHATNFLKCYNNLRSFYSFCIFLTKFRECFSIFFFSFSVVSPPVTRAFLDRFFPLNPSPWNFNTAETLSIYVLWPFGELHTILVLDLVAHILHTILISKIFILLQKPVDFDPIENIWTRELPCSLCLWSFHLKNFPGLSLLEKKSFDSHFASLMLTGLYGIYISPWASWEFNFDLRNTELLFEQDIPVWQQRSPFWLAHAQAD